MHTQSFTKQASRQLFATAGVLRHTFQVFFNYLVSRQTFCLTIQESNTWQGRGEGDHGPATGQGCLTESHKSAPGRAHFTEILQRKSLFATVGLVCGPG